MESSRSAIFFDSTLTEKIERIYCVVII